MSLIQISCFRSALSTSVRNVVQLSIPALHNIQIRERSTKHWSPEFKKLRRMKVMKVDLPDFNEERDPTKLSPDEIKSKMKELGVLPPRSWIEKPFFTSSTGGVFEAYVPPEGDGKLSALSLGRAKQSMEFLTKKSKSMLAVRKIRSFDDDFDPKMFPQTAQDIYIKAHKALAEKDYDTLHSCATELSFPLMTDELRKCTLRWEFIKSLEAPRVVHARCTDVITKENIFAQVTVRFLTQQTLAVYDRFGRLMHGSEVIVKDVLEYVVFEKHLSNLYGEWRIHEKVIPQWMPVRDDGLKTFVAPPPPVLPKVTDVVPATEEAVV